MAANLVTIDAERAFEVIEMNKRGEKPVKLDLDLSMFAKGEKLEMINDDKKGEPVKTVLTVKNPEKVSVTLNPSSGFVIKGTAN